MRENEVLKVQYGDVYIQVPPNDKEACETVLKFLSYFIEKIQEKEAKQ